MLKFLLIVVLILFILRLFGKFIIVTSFKKMGGHSYKAPKDIIEDEKKKEGRITIQKGTKGNDKPDGDYVDYVEVKE